MRTPLSVSVSVLGLLILCADAAPPLHARQQFIEVLGKGSEWTMQIDGDTATLELLGGRGQRTSGGGFELKYDVTWGGTQGVLEGASDPANDLRRVAITLALAGGERLRCSGFLARGDDDMMAGTCDSSSGRGAWYAVRAGTVPSGGKGSGAQKPATGSGKAGAKARDHRVHPVVAQPEVQADPGSAAGRPCAGQGVAPSPMSRVEGRATGVYEVGGKTDSTIRLDFPDIPGSSSTLGKWLDAHNDGLLSALRSLYSNPDINHLLGTERSRCVDGGIYCQMGFRQQALSAALAGAR